MMEDRGFATTAIGLSRYQMEQVRPPRGVWTPFQLGRPLGEPEDRAFQRRVIMQALELLERTDGPVILEDFPDDPPGWLDRPGWTAPTGPAEHLASDPEAMGLQLDTELAAIRPSWQEAQARYGRTTVGLSFQDPATWPGFVAEFLAGGRPVVASYRTSALALRYLGDDIRAMYAEAAQAAGPTPASRQIDAWFWRETIAGQVLIALRNIAVTGDDAGLKTIGARFLVPTIYLPPDAPKG